MTWHGAVRSLVDPDAVNDEEDDDDIDDDIDDEDLSDIE